MGSITRKYYVYVLARPNGAPFYVGKGTGDRVHRHEYLARKGAQSHCCNVIRKIWRKGGQVQKQIVFTTDDEAGAFAYEALLIAQIGRQNLTNRSDGGEGPTGHRKSDATRERLRVIARQRSPETLAKMWHLHTPEARTKMSASRTGKKLTPEHRANQSRGKKGKRFTQEHRANLSASLKEAMNRPEMQERRRAYRHSLEAKAKIAESNRKRTISDETRAKLRAAAARGRAAQKAKRVTGSDNTTEDITPPQGD